MKNASGWVLNLEAGSASRWEAVLQGPGEGVEHDPLAGGFREVGGQVAQQDGCVGPDGCLLIHLLPITQSDTHTDTHTPAYNQMLLRSSSHHTCQGRSMGRTEQAAVGLSV